MSWKEITLTWQDNNHPWSTYGVDTTAPTSSDDPLYAKGLFIWKKMSFGDFVEKITVAYEAGTEFCSDRNIITGFILTVAAANLIPLHIKIIKEDEHADRFVSIIKMENGVQYFLKSDLAQFDELDGLVDYLVENSLLNDRGDRFEIAGKVLNRAHILN